MQDKFDVVIIGGGHNGMVAAGYLSRAGRRVLLLESRATLGGPAGNIEYFPGYRTSVTNSPGSLEPRIVEDLELRKYGLEFTRTSATLVHPLASGDVFVSWRDKSKTTAQFEAFRKGESDRYDAFQAYLSSFAKRLGVSVFAPPPRLKELVKNLDSIDAEEAFSRIFFGSAKALFEEFDLAPETQAVLGPLSVVSGQASPSTPGTPLNLLMRPLSLASLSSDDFDDPRKQPLRGSTGLPVGGMGAVIGALKASLLSSGVSILHREADSVITKNGMVSGVATTDGLEFYADTVISAVNPRTTADRLLRDAPEWSDIRARLGRRSMKGKGFKLVLALDRLPTWWSHTQKERLGDDVSGVQFRIAPSIEHLEAAHSDMTLGRVPSSPIIWGLVPSVASPELAPDGRHIMSLNIGNAPYELSHSTWGVEAEPFASRIVDTMEHWMPGLSDSIVDMRYLDPLDIEAEFGMVESNITHGDALPWNQFWMRPLPELHDYRTPTEGLYLSGAGTWPGNFVSGIPGFNASNLVLADQAQRLSA